MDKNILEETAKKMMTRPKGILAMDESSPTTVSYTHLTLPTNQCV